MTNEGMAASAPRLAESILKEAKRHQRDQMCGLAVRRSQEAAELALKAVLKYHGLEVPRVHDVSGFLGRHRDRLPVLLRGELERISRISRTLREEREISFYGDEEAGFPPEELYTADDAERAVSDATFVYDLCDRIIKGEPT